MERDAVIADWYDRNVPGEHDHYTQPANLLRLMNEQNNKRIPSVP